MTVAPISTPVVGNVGGAGGTNGGIMTGFGTAEREEDDDEEDDEDEEKLLRIDELELLLLIFEENDEEEEEENDDENDEDEKDEDDDETEDCEELLVIGEAWHNDRANASVVTVPPNDKAMPIHDVFAPTVIPALSMMMPANVVLAASVVAWVGVQKTLHAEAPLSETIAPTVDVRAPATLKMNVPLPLSVTGPPMFIAPELQYTPGV